MSKIAIKFKGSFKKTKKALLVLFLSSNLVLLSTGSAELNLATDSAQIDQATQSATVTDGQAASSQLTTQKMTFQLDPTGTYAVDRLIVKFKDSVLDPQKRDIVTQNRAFFIEENLNLGGAKVIKVTNPTEGASVLQNLKNNPNVEYVEQDAVMISQQFVGGSGGGVYGTGTGSCSPNDYYWCQKFQWGLKQIAAPTGWLFGKGSSSSGVAVLDTGVNYNHYDLGLAPVGRVVKGPDIVNTFEFPWDPMDENGHGTRVAGIIGAITNNTSGIAGVDWYTKILAIRVSTGDPTVPSYTSWLAAGIREVVNYHPEVQVINISSGTTANTATLRNAVSDALAQGKVIIAATFNSSPGNTNCFMGFPAGYTNVISVVATDQSDNHTSGCTGRTASDGTTVQEIQLAAPGKDIFTTLLDGTVGFAEPFAPNGATSWATPFVSGVASVVASCLGGGGAFSADPTLVRNSLKLGVDNKASIGWDSTYGFGRINLYKALDVYCF